MQRHHSSPSTYTFHLGFSSKGGGGGDGRVHVLKSPTHNRITDYIHSLRKNLGKCRGNNSKFHLAIFKL